LAKDRFDLNICAVIADAGLDSAKVLSFIIKDLKAKPYIARNLRREKDLKVSSKSLEKDIPSVPGCTIAHITVLLIALTAAKSGNKDKIHLVKSFLPNI